MGATLSLRPFWNRERMKVTMLGFDAAGKSTILYKACTGEVKTSIPTIGINVEEAEVHGDSYVQSFNSWDIGGRCPIRGLWRHLWQGTDVLVYVIDSNDVERLEEVGDNLQALLLEEALASVPVLLFANKQDLPGALPPLKIVERLGLEKMLRGRHWYIEGTCANSGHGILSGFDWAARTVSSIRCGETPQLTYKGGESLAVKSSLSRLAMQSQAKRKDVAGAAEGESDSGAETESTAATETGCAP